MPSRQSRCCAGVEPRFFARHLSKNQPPGSSLPKATSSVGFPCGEQMRACWAATLLVLVQPSPASYATCRGTSVVPRVLALTHRHRHKSPCVRQPFAEISGNISFSPLWFLSRKLCPIFVCHFKGSLQIWTRMRKSLLFLGGGRQCTVQAQIHCGFGVVVGPSTA